MADLLLSVDLDPKDAVQTAKNLKKEVDKIMETGKSNGSSKPSGSSPVNTEAIDKAKAKMAELEAKMKEAAMKQEELVRQLEKLRAIETPTKEYADLEEQLRQATSQLEALRKEMQEDERAGGELYLHSSKLEEDAKKAEELEDKIIEIGQKLEDIKKQGTQFIDPTTTEEYQKLLAKLEAVNAKINQMNIQHEQAENKVNSTAQAVVGLKKETSDTQQIVKMMAGNAGFGGIGKSITTLLKGLKKVVLAITAITLGVRGIMGIVNRLRSMIKEGFKYLMEGDKDLKKRINELKDSFDEVKANLAAAFLPIIEIAIPYIQQLINWINVLISKLAMFVAAIAGQNAYTKAIKKTGDAAASASKQLSKFDELNNLTTNGNNNWSTQQIPIDQKMIDLAEKFKTLLAMIKQEFMELVANPFKEGFSAAIGDWQTKIDVVKENIKGIGKSLYEVFTDPEVIKSSEEYVKASSKFLGAGSGLVVNAGMNVGMAFTGGVEQFLDDNKEAIKKDVSDMLTLDTENLDKGSEILISISQIIDQIGESEPLINAISNGLSAIWNTLVLMKESASEFSVQLFDVFGPSITENIEGFKQLLDSLFHNYETDLEFWKSVSETVKETIIGLQEAVRPWFEEMGQILSDITAKVIEVWTTYIAPIIDKLNMALTELWQEYIDPIMQDIVAIVTDTFIILAPLLKSFWNDVLKPVIDWIAGTVIPVIAPIADIIIQVVVTALKLVFNTIKTVFGIIREIVGFIKDVVTGDIDGAIEHLKGIFKVFFDGITNALKLAWNLISKVVADVIEIVKGLVDMVVGWWNTLETVTFNLLDTILGVFSKIKTSFEESKSSWKNFWLDTVNIAIDALNSLLTTIENGLNTILGALSSTGISDFVNEKLNISIPTSVTGLIPKLNNIPALAQGAVIPPSMSDFIARLGDNNREAEIVSPLSTMKEALLEALQEAGGSGEYHIHVDVDGREIAKTVVKQNEMYRKSTGKSLFAY